MVLTRAFSDFLTGLRASDLWLTLAVRDIQRQYRLTFLGPLWGALNMGVLVAVLGFIFGRVGSHPLEVFLPHLCAGLLLWTFISTTITQGCHSFTSAAPKLKNINIPLFVFVFNGVAKQLIVLMHSSIVFLVVWLIYMPPIHWHAIFIPLSLLLYVLNGVWISVMLGTIATKYRDVIPIIEAVLRVAFYATPVLWMPERFESVRFILDFNPIYHFMELVRAPLMGEPIAMMHIAVVSAITLIGGLVSLYIYARFRNRLIYWL